MLTIAPRGARCNLDGVRVIYADEESFTLMSPEGHMLAGWITFSAFRDARGVTWRRQALYRMNDFIYEVGARLAGMSSMSASGKRRCTTRRALRRPNQRGHAQGMCRSRASMGQRAQRSPQRAAAVERVLHASAAALDARATRRLSAPFCASICAMSDPGRVRGSLVLAFAGACVNLQFFVDEETLNLTRTLDPEEWYPLRMYTDMTSMMAEKYRYPAPILEQVGMQMTQLWYTGRATVSSLSIARSTSYASRRIGRVPQHCQTVTPTCWEISRSPNSTSKRAKQLCTAPRPLVRTWNAACCVAECL